MRKTIGVPEETHAAIISLQSDAMKHLKREVSIGEVVTALVQYAKMPHEGEGAIHHHLVWTDRMEDDSPA